MVAAVTQARSSKLPSLHHITELAKKLCEENNAALLYLTACGSTLYGTEIDGKSDLDVRGVFLPNAESIVLGKPATASTARREKAFPGTAAAMWTWISGRSSTGC